MILIGHLENIKKDNRPPSHHRQAASINIWVLFSPYNSYLALIIKHVYFISPVFNATLENYYFSWIETPHYSLTQIIISFSFLSPKWG